MSTALRFTFLPALECRRARNRRGKAKRRMRERRRGNKSERDPISHDDRSKTRHRDVALSLAAAHGYFHPHTSHLRVYPQTPEIGIAVSSRGRTSERGGTEDDCPVERRDRRTEMISNHLKRRPAPVESRRAHALIGAA
jgi:hypothetical protein